MPAECVGGLLLENRSFLVIDAEDSSSRLDPALLTLRATLHEVMEAALKRTGVGVPPEEIYDRGDGALYVLDRDVDRAELAGPLLDQVVAVLAEHNQQQDLEDWLRVRIALSAGEVQRDDRGWSGAALTATFRIANADAVKRTLRSAGRAQCVVVCSDEFFRGVVRHGHSTSRPQTYREVAVPLGPNSVRAWVRVPGYTEPPVPADAVPRPAPAASGGGITSIFTESVQVGRDFTIGSSPAGGGC